MLRIRQSEDEIIIREIPFLKWINALITAIVVFFIALIAVSSVKGIASIFWLLCLIAPLVGFLLYLFTYQTVTTKINLRGQTVSVRKKSLIKYEFSVYSFSEIAGLIYVELKNESSGRNIHQLIMPLKDGEKIELSTADGSKKSQYFDAAHLMNPYIFDTSKQIPFDLTILNDD